MRQSIPNFPESIAQDLTNYDLTDVHNAISRLPKEDVNKLFVLIDALRRINENDSSHDTTKILNEVENYLNRWLTDLNTPEPESGQGENNQWWGKPLKEFLDFIQRGVDLHSEINSLHPNHKKELIALGYFLQGELSTEEEFEYIKKILKSYLAQIQKFRTARPPQ